MNRRWARARPATDIAFWQNASRGNCAASVRLGESVRDGAIGAREIVLLVVLGLACTALAHTLFIAALRTRTAHTASVIAALEPVYGIALAFALLGEVPSLRTLAGGALIVAAAATRDAAGEPRHGWLAAAETVASRLRLRESAPECRSASSVSAAWAATWRAGSRVPASTSSASIAIPRPPPRLRRSACIEPRRRSSRSSQALSAPRIVWLMVPAGRVTELAVEDAVARACARRSDRRRRQRELQGFAAARHRARLRRHALRRLRRFGRRVGTRERLHADVRRRCGRRRDDRALREDPRARARSPAGCTAGRAAPAISSR